MREEKEALRNDIEETKNHLNENLLRLEDRLKTKVQDAAKSTVQKLSPRYQVDAHPLVAAGVAVAAGVVAGKWMASRPEPYPAQVMITPPPASVFNFQRELSLIKNIAVVSLVQFAVRKVQEALPQYSDDIGEIVDGVVEKTGLGGGRGPI